MSSGDPTQQTSSVPEAHMRPFLHSGEEDRSGDELWNRYLDVVEKEDIASIERWQGSTNGLLTFTGIFAATVATFLSQSFQQLQPDSAAQTVFVGNQTVYLLAQLVSASNPTLAVPNPDLSQNPFNFQVSRSAVILNSLWFLSLVISLICTLLATLVQEWSRDFQRASQRHFSDKTVKEAAFNHIYQRMGVDRFGLDYMTSIIVGFIHIAVALFLVGLAIFLFPVHHVPAWVVIIFSALAAAFYIVASIIPIFAHDCPYYTWLTPVFGRLCWIGYTLTCGPFLIRDWVRRSRSQNIHQKIWPSLFFALVHDVGRYTYELFDSDVDWIFMKDLPQDLKTDKAVQHWLGDRSIDWNTFMNGSRLAFVWKRMSGYLLLDPKDNEEAIGALLDHLPRQIAEERLSEDVSAFVVHLRRREKFMRPLVHRMSQVDSLATAVGSLKLLQVLIDADSPDAAMYDFLGGHWKVMDDTIAKHFQRILKRIDSIHKVGLCGIRKDTTLVLGAQRDAVVGGGDLSVLIGVTKLRRTIIRKRNEMLQSARTAAIDAETQWIPPQHVIEKIKPLDKMLLCIDEVPDFRMLPIKDTDGWEPSEAQECFPATGWPAFSTRNQLKEDLESYDLKLDRTLLAQNMLTLVAYLICSELQATIQAKQSCGLHTAIVSSNINPESEESTYERTLSHLHDWFEKHDTVTKRELPDASDQQPSALFMYLCETSIKALKLRAIEEGVGGRVNSIELTEGDPGRVSLKVIKDLLNSLLRGVCYRRPHSQSTSPGQTDPFGTGQVPQALKTVHALFFTNAHQASTLRTVVPQQVSLHVPQLEELGLDLVLRSNVQVPATGSRPTSSATPVQGMDSSSVNVGSFGATSVRHDVGNAADRGRRSPRA